ncbi:D-alanyl-D-alanine carboxypeptidase/D-alanyl-D-alanine-endopeptidase [Methylophilus sp. 13]|uniref:D-alanyl-D-alanine carboxypeptidase/D-alanyl-D-alanine endopeptidase n=1 Tax=Methylophilus sp. 13 TaxID=2781018 RepID=UPI00188E661E|nr:D-alanyl-D-alanine carboxypeptidase/D-alanyl-D-alanine-endopeptidase [Methylophilus sp. 13]MBF5040199.1 D-alanyl-D-alanine carboxypeptidase/D-alanyl-D-alanine-endopeptidase [Methylophilus sp. 13]
MRWWLLFASLWPALAQAALPASLQDALAKAQLPLESVAIVVQPVEGGPPLISHHASKAMNPASVMKLVTTYAALEALTPAYRWKTEVYRNGPLNQGVLEGDLIIKGAGDPALNVAEFWRLLQQIQQQGVRQIKGNLLLDLTLYAPEVSQRPVLDDEPWRAYNANPSALLLNGRNTSFRFSVSSQANKPAVLIAQEFELPNIHIINTMQVRKGACNDWRSDLHYSVTPQTDGVTVAFSGTLPEQCDERYLELSVLSDTHYVYATFKKLWAQLGGQFNGQLALAPVTDAAIPLTTWSSPPLDSVVRDINKWSNNVMARQVMLTIAQDAGFTPADEAGAALVLKQVLRQRGLVFSELVLENGSGLSRNERISAEHLAQLLVTAYQRPVMPVFMASLPILGMDGTTKKRLADSTSKGMAYLKTGSLEGVSSLAGYVQDQAGKRYVLVIVANHARASAVRAVQDLLLKQLIEGY